MKQYDNLTLYEKLDLIYLHDCVITKSKIDSSIDLYLIEFLTINNNEELETYYEIKMNGIIKICNHCFNEFCYCDNYYYDTKLIDDFCNIYQFTLLNNDLIDCKMKFCLIHNYIKKNINDIKINEYTDLTNYINIINNMEYNYEFLNELFLKKIESHDLINYIFEFI